MSAALRSRALGLALAGITAAGLVARVSHLSDQPILADDAAVGQTAICFTESGWPDPTMWNHPRLRDLLVAGSLRALGPGPSGLKIWSVLAGVLAVPATAALVLAAGGGPLAACIAAALVAIDPLHVDFSRQAINDVYLSLFPVLGLALAFRYRTSRSPALLVGAGVALGLGLASKWSAAFAILLAAALVAADAFRRPITPDRGVALELSFGGATLVVLPLAIYLATFLPWFTAGHTLGEWVGFQRAAALETAAHVGYGGTKLPGYLGEQVGAWRWWISPAYFLDAFPPTASGPAGGPTFLAGVSNPLASLAVWPAVVHAAWRAVRARDAAARALLLAFAAAYAPFALAGRPIFTNSAVGVLPLALALVGLCAARAWSAVPRLTAAWAAACLVAAAVLWSPAAGLSTAASDRALRLLVPADAFERAARR